MPSTSSSCCILNRIACGAEAAARAPKAVSSLTDTAGLGLSLLTNPTSSEMSAPAGSAAAEAGSERAGAAFCHRDCSCCDINDAPSTSLATLPMVAAAAEEPAAICEISAGEAFEEAAVSRLRVAAGLRPKPMYRAGDGAGAAADALAEGIISLLSSSEF
jgi:hypothetical protein